MVDLPADRTKLLHRVRRIRGQLHALERLLLDEEACDCASFMQQIAAARGAMDGLMTTVMECHIRESLHDTDRTPGAAPERGAQELIGVLRTYLR